MRILLVLLLLITAPFPRAATAEIATIRAAHDNTLFEDADGDTSNGAGPAVFAGRNSQDRTRRGLLAFDLAGAVPAGARIDGVSLTLHVSSAADTAGRTFTLHPLRRDWGEGASSSSGGAGAPARPGDATWVHAFHPSITWDEVGGDFDPEPSAAQVVGDVGPATWTGPGLVVDVLAWLADPTTNHGWLVRGDESGPRTVRRFDSREAPAVADRPVLTILYSRPDPVASPAVSWGRLKSTYRRGDP